MGFPGRDKIILLALNIRYYYYYYYYYYCYYLTHLKCRSPVGVTLSENFFKRLLHTPA